MISCVVHVNGRPRNFSTPSPPNSNILLVVSFISSISWLLDGITEKIINFFRKSISDIIICDYWYILQLCSLRDSNKKEPTVPHGLNHFDFNDYWNTVCINIYLWQIKEYNVLINQTHTTKILWWIASWFELVYMIVSALCS